MPIREALLDILPLLSAHLPLAYSQLPLARQGPAAGRPAGPHSAHLAPHRAEALCPPLCPTQALGAEEAESPADGNPICTVMTVRPPPPIWCLKESGFHPRICLRS